MKLIECVPNFSTGRDPAAITAITAAIESVDGVTLLDVDPGEATNRTVVTFVGEPGPIEDAAFAAIATAAEVIDMATHSGEHPRMGATDVCPFVPMEGAAIEDCAAIARRLGERVGTELGIPVYLYEHEHPRRSAMDRSLRRVPQGLGRPGPVAVRRRRHRRNNPHCLASAVRSRCPL